LLAGAAGSLKLALANLVAVTLGNIVGGLIVASAIWMAYLRGPASPARELMVRRQSAAGVPAARGLQPR
jgi:hypothetical protein